MDPAAGRASEKGKVYTSASVMVVNDLVITGIAGGDSPMRGFIVAYHANTGKEAWRFYTIPKPGEPLSETWVGRALAKRAAARPGKPAPMIRKRRTLYWAVGNPYPDTDPSERGGTNLYTNSVVALDAKTGKFKWHYQFTPYDTHDWDATEPMVLADTVWKGKPRKLLMSAQRSGVFYVLDRITGEFLLAKPFVRKITWADGFDPKTGAAHLVPGNIPTESGHQDLSGRARRHQLVSRLLQSADQALLCDGGGGLRHLSQQGQDFRQQSGSFRYRHTPGAGAEYRDRRDRLGKADAGTAGDQL